MSTKDRYGRTVGGSVAICPRCGGCGRVEIAWPGVTACDLCPNMAGLLRLPLPAETADELSDDEAMILGLDTDDAEAVKAAWLRGESLTEAA